MKTRAGAPTSPWRTSCTVRPEPWPTTATPCPSPREQAGWSYSSLRVLDLPPGGSHELATGADEVLVLPLAGSAVVECEGERFRLAGRASVFSGVTDFAYLPPAARAVIQSGSGGRFALPGARAARRLPPRYGPASDVPVELRGAGACSRQVNNFCTPGAFEADRLIACEVITPAGNWSSYPPHKHDQERPGETQLEEIYYFEIAPGPAGTRRRLPPRVRHRRTGRLTCWPRSGRATWC